MDKKTGRYGFLAGAVLFFMYYSMGPVSLAVEHGVDPAKVPVLTEMGLEEKGGLVNLTDADVKQQLAAEHSQESESLHDESLPDNSAIFLKFLAVINEQVKRIRLLVLGES